MSLVPNLSPAISSNPSDSPVAVVSQVVSPDPTKAGTMAPPLPKKAKFLRRLIDFFHQIGSNHGSLSKEVSPSLESSITPPCSQTDAHVPSMSIPMTQPSGSATSPIMVAHGKAHAHAHSKFHFKFFSRLNTSGSRQLQDNDDAASHHLSNSIGGSLNGLSLVQQQHRRASSRSSAADTILDEDERISEEEMEIVRERIPTVTEASELCFKRKYKFLGNQIIGKGASGVVRLGCARTKDDEPLGPPVPLAVKEFRKRRKNETPGEYLRKLTREFCIAASLSHPNVVRTIDMMHDGCKWYEIMEYCQQGDLFSFIQHGGLKDMSEIDWCFKQIVNGVVYLHSQGIAHRDLKPENLLVDAAGLVKITDFGVSDLLCPPSQQQPLSDRAEPQVISLSKGVCGSSPYIAPEQFTGLPYDGRLVDVWSLGIIYYAMVFHGIPWESATSKDGNYMHYANCCVATRSLGHGNIFEPFTRLPHGSRRLLRRMLEPDPAKRITIAEVQADEWFQAIPMVTLVVHHPDEDILMMDGLGDEAMASSHRQAALPA